MLKIAFILLFLFPAICRAQTLIGLSLAPTDLALGLKVESFSRKNGLYGLLSYGTYKTPWMKVPHGKIEGGYTRIADIKDQYVHTTLSVGVSYNYYHEHPELANPRAFYPLTFNLGGGIIIKGKYRTGFDYDFIKNESQIYFLIRFRL